MTGIEMNDEELAELLGELQAVLLQAGLAPVVEQQRAERLEGRPVEVTSEDLRSGGRRNDPSRPAAGDVRRVPLTVREQLAKLLDATEAAVGGSFALEQRVRGMAEYLLRPSVDSGELAELPHPTVSFSVPSEVAGGQLENAEWSLELMSGIQARGPAVEVVLDAIDQLRIVADVQRAEWLELDRDQQVGATDGQRRWL